MGYEIRPTVLIIEQAWKKGRGGAFSSSHAKLKSGFSSSSSQTHNPEPTSYSLSSSASSSAVYHTRGYKSLKSLDFSSTQLAFPLIQPPLELNSPLLWNLGKNSKDSTMFLVKLCGNLKHRMRAQTWPCNLIFSCFNSLINWVWIRCTERPPQIWVSEQGLDSFRGLFAWFRVWLQ